VLTPEAFRENVTSGCIRMQRTFNSPHQQAQFQTEGVNCNGQ
jgi:hypothetical protein